MIIELHYEVVLCIERNKVFQKNLTGDKHDPSQLTK